MKYTYTALFKKEGSKVYARVPDLDGCITTGKNLDDAIDQMTDAMSNWLVVAEDEGMEIPQPTEQSRLKTGSDEVVSLIKADTLEYRAKTDIKSVRKNVSLPAFLARLADQKKLNCSQILQEALYQKLNNAV